MNNTVHHSRWSKIRWTGPGSNPTGLHTKKEFLQIVRIEYPERIYRRIRGEREIPEGRFKRDDITSWMAFTGARYQ